MQDFVHEPYDPGHWSPRARHGGGDFGGSIVEARKLEHGFRRIRARIPYNLP